MQSSRPEEVYMTDPVREAIRQALKSNPAGLKACDIAKRMGVNQSSLYRWGEGVDQDIPLARLVQLVLISGDPRPVAALCRLVGGLFVVAKWPAVSKEAATDALVKAIKEFADLTAEASKDIIDGQIDSVELERICREGGQAQVALAQLLDVLQSLAEKRS